VVAIGEIATRIMPMVKELSSQGVNLNFLAIHLLSPFDEDSIIAATKNAPFIFTVEQHVRHGGLASRTALTLAQHGVSVRNFKSFAISDRYVAHAGTQEMLESQDGLDIATIKKAILSTVSKNNTK